MAGKPRSKRVLEDLRLRAVAELGDDNAEPSALDYLEHWLGNGGTLIRLAHELQTASKTSAQGEYDPTLSGATISRILRKAFGDGVVDDTAHRARARGAHALVEETHDIADESVASSEDASRARNRIGSRQWAATAYARDTFGNRGNQVAVQVNLGSLHIDALRQRAVSVTVSEPLALPPAQSVVSDDESMT